MLPPTIKQRVRESFDRAAITYDGAAVVQRRVCDRLLDELQALQHGEHELTHILDAGCGTGYGARLLRSRWPSTHITGVDFAPAMLEIASQATDACFAADIEKLPFEDRRFDLWWSSLTIQWCNTHAVFGEAARVLRADGWLALSTLGPDTFHELRTAFASVDQHRHTLPFSEPEEVSDALRSTGFANITQLRERHTVHYPDLKTLLRAVKAIGAQNVGEGGRTGMMGRKAWLQLEAAYEQHREPAGLPASYDVILAYGQK
jgi:malonyl-CoA O-methyltransferase